MYRWLSLARVTCDLKKQSLNCMFTISICWNLFARYLLLNDGHHNHCSFSSWIPFKGARAASEVVFLWERFCIYSSAHVGVSSQGKQNRIKRLGSPDAKTATVLRVCNQIIQRGNFMQGLRTIILPKRGQSWCCRAQDFDSRPLQSALGRSICQPHRL